MLAFFRIGQLRSPNQVLGSARDDSLIQGIRNIHLRSTKFLSNDVTNPNSLLCS
ncbi:MAG: hypothetical protein QOD84_1797 [Acidobacteriaceae bacterium]|jgi:hypothetical protein